MHLVSIRDRPYTVINGKDYAVYRWFDGGRNGPLFIQVAGRTGLTKEDLPNSDWVVKTGRDHNHRIATAWRHPWFDYRVDAARRLAFLGASQAGSIFLALQYLAHRFGLGADTPTLAARATDLDVTWDVPGPSILERYHDRGLTDGVLLVLDLPSYFNAEHAARVLGTDERSVQ
ncbi:MAG TPA: hypothetical protein PLS53_01305 [Thermoanaerobaculaceae bacterium]|nr:hypothetical protein [Thermoanaerobaculaceae bacterium]HPS76773.1 hypothetical protein [Thermoanaerobaculaceae bacterium]